MDELGVDVQILLPGLFLTWMTDRPEVERALCGSYNRWMAEACHGQSRFRWVLVPPVLDVENAISEVEFGAKNGACGILLRGIEGERQLSDPYFHPIFERAQALNLPIVVHTSNGNRYLCGLRLTNPHFWATGPVMAAFHILLQHRIPSMFPSLKFAFLETGAQWVPEAVRWQKRTGTVDVELTEALAANNFYVAVRTDNDLPYVAQYGANNLIFGTDFCHSDPNAEIDGFDTLRNAPDISPAVKEGMIGKNASTLFEIAAR